MDVVSDVIVHQSWVQRLKVSVVHVLKDEAWGLGLRVSDHVKQLNDVGTSAEVLQDLNLSLDLQGRLHPSADRNHERCAGLWDHASEVTFFFFTGFRILMMHF